MKDRRQGQGACLFSDGTMFRGQWVDDAWLQSSAEPRLSTIEGWGSARAVAGNLATFMIQARPVGTLHHACVPTLRGHKLPCWQGLATRLCPSTCWLRCSSRLWPRLQLRRLCQCARFCTAPAGQPEPGPAQHSTAACAQLCMAACAPQPWFGRKAGCHVARLSLSHGSCVLQARDEDGNSRLCGGDAFAAHLAGGSETIAVLVEDQGNGRYKCSYAVTRAGEYQLHVYTGRPCYCQLTLCGLSVGLISFKPC